MFAVLIFTISTVTLGPLALCLVAFRSIFPKHTVKIHPTFLIPIGLPILVFVGVCLGIDDEILALIKYLSSEAINEELTTLKYFSSLADFFIDRTDEYDFFLSLGLFYFLPAISVFVLSWVGERFFQQFIRVCPDRKLSELSFSEYTFYWPLNVVDQGMELFVPDNTARIDYILGPIALVAYFGGWLVDTLLVNYMGSLTAYDQDQELLMMDIYVKDGFLFSGAYYDFYVEGGELTGICIVNPIRYRVQESSDLNTDNKVEAHLIPNKGKLVVPYDQISNFHIWTLKKGQIITIELTSERAVVKAFWYASFNWKYPQYIKAIKVKYDPKILFNQLDKDNPDNGKIRKKLFSERKKLNLEIPEDFIKFEAISSKEN